MDIVVALVVTVVVVILDQMVQDPHDGYTM